MQENRRMRLSMIGLGKLGAPIAAVMASRGFDVIGVDRSARVVEKINAGESPVFEPGMDEILARTQGRLTAAEDLIGAVRYSEVSFVLVPTPSLPDGRFSLQVVLPIMRQIGAALRDKPAYHTVVLVSTVMPGDTGGQVRQALEQTSGKTVGQDIGLCYSPEFVAIGSVIHDYLHPDMLLIGESDKRAGNVLEAIGRGVCLTQPKIARMNFVSAELAKIAVNTYVTTKITYANMLAELCHNLPGADVDVVTSAIGLDSRIGQRYLRGGVGYGGPCFPRDNQALVHLADAIGSQADLAVTVDQVNRAMVGRIGAMVEERALQPSARIAVLGLSYKPESTVVEQSQGLMLAQWLQYAGWNVIGYDPQACGEAHHVAPDLELTSDIEQAAKADVLVVMTPWQEVRELSPELLAREDGRPVVIDCWRCLDSEQFQSVAEIVSFGVGPDDEQAYVQRRDVA